jgi:hypothetical protein
MSIGTERSPELKITSPATPEAIKWQGWGTALKPANEPIVLARKPLSESTVAKNILKWGCGALNIDGSRIGSETRTNQPAGSYLHNENINDGRSAEVIQNYIDKQKSVAPTIAQGRWPANILFGCACENEHEPDCAVKLLDEQSGHGDSGGASRFFYCAKASKSERNRGLDNLPEKKKHQIRGSRKGGEGDPVSSRFVSEMKNIHPTVKPVKLMEYLVRLITPPGGICLDPFCGSGTTGVACNNLDFNFIGIEMNKEYCEIAEKRIFQEKNQLEFL